MCVYFWVFSCSTLAIINTHMWCPLCGGSVVVFLTSADWTYVAGCHCVRDTLSISFSLLPSSQLTRIVFVAVVVVFHYSSFFIFFPWLIIVSVQIAYVQISKSPQKGDSFLEFCGQLSGRRV